MNPETTPHRSYHHHRENQRERILEAARKLFLRDGIERVTIAQVAAAARISRVTLYQYYPDKTEIAWAVFQDVIEELHAAFVPPAGSQTETGFQKVERFMTSGIAGLTAFPEHFRFVSLFNYMYAQVGSPMRMRRIIEQAFLPGGYGILAEWIREGMADGSIRPGLDPGLTAASIANLMAAVTSRFALLESNVAEEYGYPEQDLIRQIITMALDGLRAG